ncbi:MAG: CocE/NonD family hydrolase [Deltaproteobacteria bacterium]|nr:MAG: CocE/NonD family hydrolase [Deltaproteobacteria bacterium]
MMTRTRLLVTGLLMAISSWTAAPQPAAAGSYVLTSDVRIAMPDGVLLDSDEYVPTEGCPCPTILVQTPYRKSGSAVGEGNTIFPSNGYAMIVVDVRGTGSSEGSWDSFGPKEQQDGATLVQWAASRPYSNGIVGLSGVSYSAINQFLTVEQPGTDAVKAIFPIVPMSDAYRDVTWAGGNTDAGFIPLWLGLVNGLAMIPADDAQSQPQIALNAESQHALDVAEFGGQAVLDATFGGYEMMLPSALVAFPEQAYDGDFYRIRSPIRNIGAVNIPTFIVGGTYDIFQRGEPILFNALKLSRSKKKLLIGPWYHTTAGNGLTADDGSSPVYDTNGTLIPSLNNLQLAWFDHWLKGIDNGIQMFPTVETYYLGAGKWVGDRRYPASHTKYRRWYLSANPGSGSSLYAGSLAPVTDAADTTATLPWIPLNGTCSRSTTQWTAGLVAGWNCENDNSPSEALAATFTTPPFTAPYALSGPINADIWISSNVSDTQIIATISDVDPSGASSQITAGTLVASLRAETPTRCHSTVADCSVYARSQVIEPWHPYTHASQTPLTPDAPTELQIEIFPTSAVIPAGHSLRLTLATGDFPHETLTLSTLVNSAGGIDTIYLGPDHPSSIYVGTPTPAPAS